MNKTIVSSKFKLVPITPTSEMLEKGLYARNPELGTIRGGSNNANRERRQLARIYSAMVLAASDFSEDERFS